MLNHKSYITELNGPSHYNVITPSCFPSTPEDMLNELLKQGSQINDISAHLITFISQYQAERRHLTALIKETGKQSRTSDLNPLMVRLNALINVLSDLSEFFASASAQLYFAFDFFLTELYATPQIYGTRFYSEFVNMEQSITESIQSFSLIENKLNVLQQSLYALQTINHIEPRAINNSIASLINELNDIQSNFQQNLTCITTLQSNVSQHQASLTPTTYQPIHNQFASY